MTSSCLSKGPLAWTMATRFPALMDSTAHGNEWNKKRFLHALHLILYLFNSTLNFCQAVTQFPDSICPILPTELPCECPLPAGNYTEPDAKVKFDELWLDLEGGVTVSFTSARHFNMLIVKCNPFHLITGRLHKPPGIQRTGSHFRMRRYRLLVGWPLWKLHQRLLNIFNIYKSSSEPA